MFEFNKPETLVIVYEKNWEEPLNQLRSLIDSKDDTDEEVVGSKDGSIQTVQFEAEKWQKSDLPSNTTSKILFLGHSKASDSWANVLPVRFSEYGIRIGWDGRRAMILGDRPFESGMEYLEFTKEFMKFPVPPALQSHILEYINENNKWKDFDRISEKAFALGWRRLRPSLTGNDMLAKLLSAISLRQQMFYGIFQFYYHGLEEFMNS